uniref:Uncharacterized protein n=1 Tax=Erythrolobus australicus TaxID=1077150 RepID=A0A7S1TMB6_9RHOD
MRPLFFLGVSPSSTAKPRTNDATGECTAARVADPTRLQSEACKRDAPSKPPDLSSVPTERSVPAAIGVVSTAKHFKRTSILWNDLVHPASTPAIANAAHHALSAPPPGSHAEVAATSTVVHATQPMYSVQPAQQDLQMPSAAVRPVTALPKSNLQGRCATSEPGVHETAERAASSTIARGSKRPSLSAKGGTRRASKKRAPTAASQPRSVMDHVSTPADGEAVVSSAAVNGGQHGDAPGAELVDSSLASAQNCRSKVRGIRITKGFGLWF